MSELRKMWSVKDHIFSFLWNSWTEDLRMTADMTVAQGNSKVKTKATIMSTMKVANYFEVDYHIDYTFSQ